jgi:hypothetical protein
MKEANQNVIGIHSVPRSGSSWLGQIFNSSPYTAYRFQPFFSHAFKGIIDNDSSKLEIESFFQDLFNTTDPFVLQTKNISANEWYHFYKDVKPSFLVYKEVRYHYLLEHFLKTIPTYKCVLLIRNPITTLNSWMLAPKEFKPEWSFENEWKYAPSKNQNKIEEYNGFEKWKEFSIEALRLKSEYSDRVYILPYKNLLMTPAETIEHLFSFCEISVTEQTFDFLKRSATIQNDDPYSVFKIKQSDNISDLKIPNSVMEQIVMEVAQAKLEQFL